MLRVQERDGGVTVARMDAWSSRELRQRWWRAMVDPVLGEAPPNATAVTVAREETN
jgi:L-rhamnose mutarotase